MMKIILLTVVLLSLCCVGFIQGKNSEGGRGEPENERMKRHYGYHGSRPTYGGYQTIGSYQHQQQQQPNYANQRPQPAHGGEYTSYQQPNNHGFGNMRSYGYYQQPAQNFYQPSYQQDHLTMRYQ